MLVGTIRFKNLEDHYFAYSFITKSRYNVNLGFDPDIEIGDVIPGIPGLEEYTNDVNLDNSIKEEWIGLIMNVGVVLEIGYTIALPWLIARFGGKWVITVGFAAMSLRMGFLAHYPSVATALVTQISHGLEIMAIFVVPVMLFDKLAGDSYRNSIQGAYSMLMAIFRVLGSMLAGFIASIDTVLAFEYGSVLALAAFFLVLFYFREPSTVPKSVESPS